MLFPARTVAAINYAAHATPRCVQLSHMTLRVTCLNACANQFVVYSSRPCHACVIDEFHTLNFYFCASTAVCNGPRIIDHTYQAGNPNGMQLDTAQMQLTEEQVIAQQQQLADQQQQQQLSVHQLAEQPHLVWQQHQRAEQ